MKIIKNIIIAASILVVFLFLLYVIYPNIYFVPYFSYLINDNRQSLYKTPTETINISKQECPKHSYTTVGLDNLQLCLNTNSINEIKTIKGSKIITTKAEGKKVALMGSIDLSDLMDEFNKYPNEAKSLMSYESLFDDDNKRHYLIFGMKYTQNEINNILSRITIAPNNQMNPTAMSCDLSNRSQLIAAGY